MKKIFVLVFVLFSFLFGLSFVDANVFECTSSVQCLQSTICSNSEIRICCNPEFGCPGDPGPDWTPPPTELPCESYGGNSFLVLNSPSQSGNIYLEYGSSSVNVFVTAGESVISIAQKLGNAAGSNFPIATGYRTGTQPRVMLYERTPGQGGSVLVGIYTAMQGNGPIISTSAAGTYFFTMVGGQSGRDCNVECTADRLEECDPSETETICLDSNTLRITQPFCTSGNKCSSTITDEPCGTGNICIDGECREDTYPCTNPPGDFGNEDAYISGDAFISGDFESTDWTFKASGSLNACEFRCTSDHGWDESNNRCVPQIQGICSSSRATTHSWRQTSWPSGSEYCQTGIPSASPSYPNQGGSVTWTCQGQFGGSNSGLCTASRNQAQYNVYARLFSNTGTNIGINTGNGQTPITNTNYPESTANYPLNFNAQNTNTYRFRTWNGCSGSTGSVSGSTCGLSRPASNFNGANTIIAVYDQYCGQTTPSGDRVIRGLDFFSSESHNPKNWQFVRSESLSACQWTCQSGYVQSGSTCIPRSMSATLDGPSTVYIQERQNTVSAQFIGRYTYDSDVFVNYRLVRQTGNINNPSSWHNLLVQGNEVTSSNYVGTNMELARTITFEGPPQNYVVRAQHKFSDQTWTNQAMGVEVLCAGSLVWNEELNMCTQCNSGPCCDLSTGNFRDSNYVCHEAPLFCSGAGSPGTCSYTIPTTYCPGNANSCSGNLVDEVYSVESGFVCENNEFIEVSNSSYAEYDVFCANNGQFTELYFSCDGSGNINYALYHNDTTTCSDEEFCWVETNSCEYRCGINPGDDCQRVFDRSNNFLMSQYISSTYDGLGDDDWCVAVIPQLYDFGSQIKSNACCPVLEQFGMINYRTSPDNVEIFG